METPLHTLRLTGEGERLTGVYFTDGRYLPRDWGQEGETPVLAGARDWLEAYFAGEKPAWLPELAPAGTAFQQMVWEKLLQIPYGETVTYGALARALEAETGRRAAAQAVGQAVGHNPISILIPCHRVMGANGSITGYGGGLWRKEWLLRLENKDIII